MPDPTPLDDVEFLARSPHRVEVLERLREGPWTRPDLHDETGISQPTLGRVLGSLQDRNWVEKRGREYALTAFGQLVAEEFASLLDTVETVQGLGTVVGLLPTDEMDVDVRAFGDATIVTPETGDIFRHVRRVEELMSTATDIRVLTDTMASGSLEETHARLRGGDEDLRVESVLAGEALDQALANPELAPMVRDMVVSAQTPVHRYDGEIPFTMAVVDGTAILVPVDAQGLPAALIETRNEAVRSWVEATIDDYRERATAVAPEDVPA